MERWGSCPSCERPVRLTGPELESKRGFCAACDAGFTIREGAVRDAMLPFRQAPDVELVPAATPALQVEGDRLTVDTAARGGWAELQRYDPGFALALLGAALVFVGVMLAGGSSSALWYAAVAAPLGAIGVLASIRFARNWVGCDLVEVRDGALWVQSGPFRPRPIAFSDIESIEIERESGQGEAARFRLRIVRTRGADRFIGAGLGNDETTVRSIARWIDAAIAHAEAKLLPPAG